MYARLLYQLASMLSLILLVAFQFPINTSAQKLKISEFVLYSGGATSIGTGCFFHKDYNRDKLSGSIGSNTWIKTNINATINGNVYSGGIIQLDNNNTVGGNIAAANSQGLRTAISIGRQANIGGNIDVNGNTVITSGSVGGTVTHPSGSSYFGPSPSGGNIMGTPTLPQLPSLPDISSFPAAGKTNISSTKTITPGAYGNITLRGENKPLLYQDLVFIFLIQ